MIAWWFNRLPETCFPRHMRNKHKTINRLQSAIPAVLPSMLLCDFSCLRDEIEALEKAGVAALHLDVMDGVFVPNFTYGLTIVEAARRSTELPLDVHLMMVHPENYIESFIAAGADLLTIHAEAVEDPIPVLKQIDCAGCVAGLAINPKTSVASIADAIPFCDLVLVMSVNAGFGGQAFVSDVLQKFAQIRQCQGGEDVLLQIDGGINDQTIAAAVQAGADLFVAGSAIFKAGDYRQALTQMESSFAR